MSKKPKFQAPVGMHDILPEDQKYFKKIYSACESMADFYRFQKIETPILEETELFLRGIGLATDIIEKQMFAFRTKGGDHVTLRPEHTASVVRAFIEHGMLNLPQPIKLWYFGPCFRYEHPQAGRFRQFWQFGLEILGEENAVIDVQTIQIFYNILKELKLKNLTIEINSIGDSQCRPYYKKLLASYLKSREAGLCSDCRRRLKENPLRILDCKEERCQQITSQAPQMIDHLCEGCHRHFKDVLEFLDEMELPYHLNSHLVRGLDYYTKTVFEIFCEEKINASEPPTKNALVGGGRYDSLVKILGGQNTPAVGGAMGVERIIEILKNKSLKLREAEAPEIYLAQLGSLAKRKSLKLIENFREIDIQVAESLGRDSLKAQLKMADKIGAKYTLILGQQEALQGTIIIRDMQKGTQEIVKLEKIVKEMERKIKR